MFSPMLILATLATYKLAYLFVWEEGPFDIFTCFRALLGIHLVEDGETKVTVVDRVNVLTKLFTCPFCLSGWLALAFSLMLVSYEDVTLVVIVWLGIWGGACILLRIDEVLEYITSK